MANGKSSSEARFVGSLVGGLIAVFVLGALAIAFVTDRLPF
jgi:hypothetical protein